MGFHQSKGHGDQAEQLVATYLKSCGIESEFAGKNPDYDLLCKSGRTKFTIECKFDMKSEETNNLCIEIFNPKSDRPSGITSSKADLIAFVLPDGSNRTIWFASLFALRKFIGEVPPKKRVELGGDSNATLLLYNVFVILGAVFHRLDTLDCKGASALIKKLLKESK